MSCFIKLYSMFITWNLEIQRNLQHHFDLQLMPYDYKLME